MACPWCGSCSARLRLSSSAKNVGTAASHQNSRPTSRDSSAVPDRLLAVREAAALLSVKPATLYQWAYQRRIPTVKLFGPKGALRFRLSDIERLIAHGVRPALH